MPENDHETAQEQGYIGQVAEEPPNEVYTVKGQASGDQAERERDAIRERRHQREDAIREENEQAAPKSTSKPKSAPKQESSS
jgi:hypothetical protein